MRSFKGLVERQGTVVDHLLLANKPYQALSTTIRPPVGASIDFRDSSRRAAGPGDSGNGRNL
jgi:hypothetical protein